MRLYVVLFISTLFACLPLNGQTPVVTAGMETVFENETVSVPISVQNFTDVVSIQFTLEWDPAVITYQGTGDYGLPGLSEFNFGEPEVADGRLTFVWFDGQVNGVTLPDDAVVFSVSFLAIGALGESSPVDFINMPTPIQIGVIDGSVIEEVDGTFNAGEVLIVSEVLQVETSTTDNLCFGESQGSITPTVSGGVQPYTFSWIGPGGFTSIAPSLSDLAAGEYSLTITDQNGTTFNDVYTISEPTALEVVSIEVQESDCNAATGSISVNVSGGTPTYLYDYGSGLIPDGEQDELPAGMYTLTIQDASGCILETTAVIDQANGPEVQLTEDFALCPTAAATLTASPDQTLTYNWTLEGQPLPETTNEITIDEPGVYAVTATNAAGCIAEDEVEVTTANVPVLTLAETATFCAGDAVLLNANADPGLTYDWTLDGEAIPATTNEISVAISGTYAVTVTNAAGCSTSAAAEVTETLAPELALNNPFNLCPDDTASLTAGPDASLTYSWLLDGQPLPVTTNEITINVPGTYTVSSTNAAGCTATAEVTIGQAEVPELDLGEDVNICPDGLVTLQAGPDPTFVYSWALDGTPLAASTNTIEVTETGVYTVSAGNDAGCTAEDEVTVSTAILPVLDLGPDTSICEKTMLLLLANEDLATFVWTLNDNPTGTDAPELLASDPGEYILAATTTDGCVLSDTIQIETIPFATSAGPADTTIVAGEPLTLFAAGGIAYNWTTNNEVELSCNDCPNPEVTLLETTLFQVDITSEEGCARSVNFAVNVEEAPEILVDIVNFISPNGDGKNDVLIFRGLENYRGNRLTIYNRWGDLLFNKPNYQLDGEYWDGTVRGQALPPGIYFYVLVIDVASEPIKSSLTLVID